MIINECLPEDAGEYKLIARNQHGDAQSKCRLNIQAISRRSAYDDFPLEIPKFDEPLNNLTTHEGGDITLTTRISCSKPFEVNWYKNGNLLSESDRLKVSYFKFIFIICLVNKLVLFSIKSIT